MDARSVAAKWERPYTSVQWAWVRALGVAPAPESKDGAARKRRRHRRRDIRDAMRQRVGVRGL